jgi:hypothetical protein
MHLFRSEENVKSWTDFDPATAKEIKPVAKWATMVSGQLFVKRLEPDFVEKSQAYLEEFAQIAAAELGYS